MGYSEMGLARPCGCGARQEMVEVELRYRREELLYDISNCGYIEGHIMGEDTEEARHMTKDICEGGNVDRVGRMIDVVVASAVELLHPMTKRAVEDGLVLEDVREAPQEYALALTVPAGTAEGTVRLLHELVREWIVSRVVCDWLSITNTAKAEVWALKAQDAMERIRSLRNMRGGGVRRPLQPF